MLKTRLLGASALFGTLLIGAPAFAQEPAGPAAATPTETVSEDDATQGEEVIVTGSRIVRPNVDTPVPVVAVTAQQLNSVGQQSIGETLNRLPALRSTFTQSNSTGGIGSAGINLLDLRGLGTARTLVLINGRRHVGTGGGTFGVDTNTIPNDLIERIDIITGGDSGTYGSDAVSGVVNFILKNNYDGFNARLQSGVSSRGDRGSFIGSAIWGKNFADGRGNIAISAEYAYQDTLLFQDRNGQTGAITGNPGFGAVQQTLFLNPDGTAKNEPPEGDGITDQGFFGPYPGSKFNIISVGGTVNVVCPALTGTALNLAQRAANCTGALSPTGGRLQYNYMFAPDGTLVRNDGIIDYRPIGGLTLGGLGASGLEGAMLLPGLKRANFNLLAHFDVSDAFKPFIEAKYVHITNNQTSVQPTFINSTLSPAFFLDNPYLTTQAANQIRTSYGYASTNTTGQFTFFRFNNDIGTRAEDHKRETYRIVAGVRGDLLDTGNWRYEASFNYGRVETYYDTGGHFDVQKFNRATNAVRNAAGQIVCRVNADASTTNDDPACRPINLFGEGAPATTPDGLNYAGVTISREQWQDQINALYFVSGDTGGFLNMPGGPIGLAFGAEYRREDYYQDYDDFSQGAFAPGQANTTLNRFNTTRAPAMNIYEAFGEIRVPILSDVPFFDELSVEASGRVSKYSFNPKYTHAYTAGVLWAPVPDLRLRARYARSVRAPNLTERYDAGFDTFFNNAVDPCSQNVISQNPNRARNCAQAGIPTTITLPDGSVRPWQNTPTSGILGVAGGNLALTPETSKSYTLGAVIAPRFIPGLTLSVDYYNIKIKDVIASVAVQTIVNNCYDDPVSIDNEFCALISRRRSSVAVEDFTFAGQFGNRYAGFSDFSFNPTGAGFNNAPFNYAKLETSGIDAELSYDHRFDEETRLNVRLAGGWLEKRNQYTFISDPNRYTRVKSTLGDPKYRALLNGNLEAGAIDISFTSQYIGKQLIAAFNTQNTEQDRPPTNADAFNPKYYPDVFVHDIQVGVKLDEGRYRFYVGVDNITDQLPPLGLTGTGSGAGVAGTGGGAGGAIFPVTGRYFYAGVRVRM